MTIDKVQLGQHFLKPIAEKQFEEGTGGNFYSYDLFFVDVFLLC